MNIQNIIDGIAVSLYNEFGGGYRIYTENVPQGLQTPCFTVALSAGSNTAETWVKDRRINGFTVCYYPDTADPLGECCEVFGKLHDVLAVITADGINLNAVGDVRGAYLDGVLEVSVSYDYIDYIPEVLQTTPIDSVIYSLKTALNGVISGVKVVDKNIQEGFTRPCLYLDLQTIQSDLSGDMPHDICSFQLVYYANYDVLDWEQMLLDRDKLNRVLLYPIAYKGDTGGYLTVDTVNWTFDRDNVLCTAQFDIELFCKPLDKDSSHEIMSALYENMKIF